MKIAVLLTCHNRQEKTKKCLQSLKQAVIPSIISIEVFLTNDGCTDDTVIIAQNIFTSKENLHIIDGDGNMFWAGGMRHCWKEAMKRHDEWDFYLLLNDDVELMPNVFHELLEAHKCAIDKYGEEGMYSGITCDPEDHNKMTYGGNVWTNRLLSKSVRLKPSGEPQMCDVTNANILMVSKSVVDKIGIFYEGYVHGSADQDYSWTARKKGIPVLLTSHFCGICPVDHKNPDAVREMLLKMSLKERKAYFKHPLHSSKEQIISEWRMNPVRMPLIAFGRFLILYFPKLYYGINKIVRH